MRSGSSRTWLASSGLVGVLLIGAGCRGPERVPHQPIPGVDTPQNEVYNKHDDSSGTAADASPLSSEVDASPAAPADVPSAAPTVVTPAAPGFLDEFVAKVAAELSVRPGTLAIFPALSRTNSGEYEVTGLGDYLARETAEGLERQGINPLWSDVLQRELRAVNRGPESLHRVSDAFVLAERISADYVVFGTVDRRAFDRLSKDEILDVHWECQRLPEHTFVAKISERLGSGPLANDLVRFSRLKGEWTSPEEEPSTLSREIDGVSRALARKIVKRHRDFVRGKRVHVEPTRVHSIEGARADLQTFAASFERQLEALTVKALQDGKAIPEIEAMSYGPVTIQGQAFENLDRALERFGQERVKLVRMESYTLASELSRNLGEHLVEALDNEVSIQLTQDERDDLLSLLRDEARAFTEHDTLDPATLARLRESGSEIYLESTLRRGADSFQMRLTLFDLADGRKISESEFFDPWFTAQLETASNR